MHTSMSNTCISIESSFKKHLSDTACAHGLIDNGKYKEQYNKHKWTDREYHVQDIKYVQKNQ